MRASSVCAALKAEELSELEAITQPVTFAAKETLLVETDKAHAVFSITSGVVRLYRLFRDGRRHGFISVENSGPTIWDERSIRELAAV